MLDTTTLRIELHRQGTVSALDMQEHHALIGSGSHCDVRLAPDEAAVEQLLVQLVGDDIYVRARSLKPPCRLNGAPFVEGRVPEDSMIEFNGLGICVSAVARREDKVTSHGRGKSSTSPGMQLLGLAAVALGLYAVLHPPSQGDGLKLNAAAPPAPAVLREEACPQREPSAALALAEQLETQAETKRERAPFYAGDALAGAPLFQRAAACFAAAGEHERADEAGQAAQQLRTQTVDLLHLLHIRVEHSLTERDFVNARHNAELALALMSDPADPYAQWLEAVKRETLLRTREGKR
jgi:hypothetical protein